MLMKTVILATAITLGLVSAAAAQVAYPNGAAPQWSWEVEPAYPPMAGLILRDPSFAYEPGYVIEPGYEIEQDYNTGFMRRDRIGQDRYNQANGINNN